jgi:hypothetical protein
MLTQPNALLQVTELTETGELVEHWEPVTKNLWKYFARIPEALAIGKQIKTDLIPTPARIIDGLNYSLYIPIQYLSKSERMWLAEGKTTKPDGTTRSFSEWCGWLFDRKAFPAPGDAPNGKTLEPDPITSDLVELHWAA